MKHQNRKERTFGSELRRLRRSHPDNLTLAHTAKEIGCVVSQMSAIENDLRNPPLPSQIRKLMAYLGCEEVTDEMIRLAALKRGTVAFDLSKQTPSMREFLLKLSRKSEDHSLTPEEIEAMSKAFNKSHKEAE